MKKIYLGYAVWVVLLTLIAGFTTAQIRDHGVKSIIEMVWFGKEGKR